MKVITLYKSDMCPTNVEVDYWQDYILTPLNLPLQTDCVTFKIESVRAEDLDGKVLTTIDY